MRGSSRVLKSIVLAFAAISGVDAVGVVVAVVWCGRLFVCLFSCLLVCLSVVGWDIKGSDVSVTGRKHKGAPEGTATQD